MKIADMFKDGKTVFSFEIFPPKKDNSFENIISVLEELSKLNPDFISVTYGAGGTAAGCSTHELVKLIKEKYHTESIAHLTCVNSSRDEIDRIIGEFHDAGVENILALRGDINPNVPPKEDFKHASDLISYIRQKTDEFGFSGACYPEGHLESASVIDDIRNLKIKVDAGASHLITQLFFDNSLFYEFIEKARIAGITVPIEAGIMPCTNANSIRRMISMCGASLPAKFTKMIQRYENNDEAMRDAGIAYAVDQIIDLVSNGVQGIHLYTMNNPYIAKRIAESVEKVIRL
ncbi:MAG: methylenetetrahydrofolate reductase [NAD(P)H] [Oscillospiraceae bacterium]